MGAASAAAVGTDGVLGGGPSYSHLSLPFAAAPARPHCTLPELLGLCKLQLHTQLGFGGGGGGGGGSNAGGGGGSPLAPLLASPALADVVLWVLLRLHAKLCASKVYKQVR